jgi:hypothetical protein
MKNIKREKDYILLVDDSIKEIAKKIAEAKAGSVIIAPLDKIVRMEI